MRPYRKVIARRTYGVIDQIIINTARNAYIYRRSNAGMPFVLSTECYNMRYTRVYGFDFTL